MDEDTRETRDPREWTAEQIEDAVGRAIANHDFEAVVPLVKLLATKDPHRAELVLETIQLGIAIGRR